MSHKRKVTKQEQLEVAKKVLRGEADFNEIPVNDDDIEEETQQEKSSSKPIVIPELDELNAILGSKTEEEPEQPEEKEVPIKEAIAGIRQQAASFAYATSAADLPPRTDVFGHRGFWDRTMDKVLPHTQAFGQKYLKPIAGWASPKLKRVRKFAKKWLWTVPSVILVSLFMVLTIVTTVAVHNSNVSVNKVNMDNAIVMQYEKDTIVNGHDYVLPNDSKEVTTPVSGHNGEVHQDEIYTVEDGDTLWAIAETVYGDASAWTKLYEDNKDMLVKDDLRNLQEPGHWIHVGQQLVINK